MSQFIIYALQCTESDWIYVGRSSSGLRRPKQHSKPSYMKKRSDYPVVKWIKKYTDAGYAIDVVVLEECLSAAETVEAEIFHIAYLKSINMKLLNCTDGGEGSIGYRHTPETLKKLSVIARNRPPYVVSDETRLKRSIAGRGRRQTEEAKIKIRNARLGRNLSPETRAKISIATSRSRFGCKHTDEAKRKIGLAHRGKIMSAESRAKMSASHLGKSRCKRHLKMTINLLGRK